MKEQSKKKIFWMKSKYYLAVQIYVHVYSNGNDNSLKILFTVILLLDTLLVKMALLSLQKCKQ